MWWCITLIDYKHDARYISEFQAEATLRGEGRDTQMSPGGCGKKPSTVNHFLRLIRYVRVASMVRIMIRTMPMSNGSVFS